MTPEEKKRDTELYEALTELYNEFDVMGYDFSALAINALQRRFWPDGVRTPNDPD